MGGNSQREEVEYNRGTDNGEIKSYVESFSGHKRKQPFTVHNYTVQNRSESQKGRPTFFYQLIQLLAACSQPGKDLNTGHKLSVRSSLMLYSANKKKNINKHIQGTRIHSKVIPKTTKRITSAASPWPAERACV